ncbi:hypothetical protein FOA52_009156 [Chlamydomonas sp. UWO 241]|nr:hypothetical protein FOA52_009156 [Chlamydomonas sp. UWO 241]
MAQRGAVTMGRAPLGAARPIGHSLAALPRACCCTSSTAAAAAAPVPAAGGGSGGLMARSATVHIRQHTARRGNTHGQLPIRHTRAAHCCCNAQCSGGLSGGSSGIGAEHIAGSDSSSSSSSNGSSGSSGGGVAARMLASALCGTATAAVLLLGALHPPHAAAAANVYGGADHEPVAESVVRMQGPVIRGGTARHPQGVLRAEVASETEDKLLGVVRRLESKFDNALSTAAELLSGSSSEPEDATQVQSLARTLITEVWEVVDTNYLDARDSGFDAAKWARLRDAALKRPYTSSGAVYRAVRVMMSAGLSDPYCRFVSKGELAVMKKYDVTGVGMNLASGDEYVRKTGRQLPQRYAAGGGSGGDGDGVFVVGVSQGSASDAAGVVQGDEVVSVGGRDLSGISAFQAASLIQGVDSGSAGGAQTAAAGASSSRGAEQAAALVASPPEVQLRFLRADGTTFDATLKRAASSEVASPVSAQLVGPGGLRPEATGLIRLTSFNARAHRDLSSALTQMESEGAQSFVLDMRDNRGGLVSEGLEAARLFMSGGAPIVITESRGHVEDVPLAANAAPATTRPLVVLVNDHTASAAEILAGALQANCRAVLVGGQTYGKGLIQSVYELSDGSGMVLTVGKYLTPARVDIDRHGIRPDFASQPSTGQMAQALDACLLTKEHDVLRGVTASQQERAVTKALSQTATR